VIIGDSESLEAMDRAVAGGSGVIEAPPDVSVRDLRVVRCLTCGANVRVLSHDGGAGIMGKQSRLSLQAEGFERRCPVCDAAFGRGLYVEEILFANPPSIEQC
jgi:hypothetical protein